MLKKILIANRGEIAVRIIRACREIGIATVAVYSEADKHALHVQLADEAVCIGPAPSNKSYLNVKNILEAACLTGVDSIHPGYGFLSENSTFAKMCKELDITFIGPNYELIELMGNKTRAKDAMKKAGVPVPTGSDGDIETIREAQKVANEIGYPVIIKASKGGGGKGIRIAYTEEELIKYYEIVKQEAKISFKDDCIYVEKYIENPRHVEIQIIADNYGNVKCLGDRDCSIQRNNQKIIEETPSEAIDEKTREKMKRICESAIKKIGYTGVGTIEFLVDKKMNFYFMEMNTRLQVEHPVTEMVTGIDLVKEQIKIASEEKLSLTERNLNPVGHSIECRINAENASKNFMPMAGKIDELHLPGGNGIRVDTAIYSGYVVPSNYDSLLAKVVVHAENRKQAINKMKCAISEFVIEGITTNVDFLYRILENEDFINNNYDTSFINKLLSRKSIKSK